MTWLTLLHTAGIAAILTQAVCFIATRKRWAWSVVLDSIPVRRRITAVRDTILFTALLLAVMAAGLIVGG